MVTVVVTDIATRTQILDETICISQSDNTTEKGMNSIIFSLAMVKLLSSMKSSILVSQSAKEKENSEFKPVKSPLKVYVLSRFSYVEGKVNIYTYIL